MRIQLRPVSALRLWAVGSGLLLRRLRRSRAGQLGTGGLRRAAPPGGSRRAAANERTAAPSCPQVNPADLFSVQGVYPGFIPATLPAVPGLEVRRGHGQAGAAGGLGQQATVALPQRCRPLDNQTLTSATCCHCSPLTQCRAWVWWRRMDPVPPSSSRVRPGGLCQTLGALSRLPPPAHPRLPPTAQPPLLPPRPLPAAPGQRVTAAPFPAKTGNGTWQQYLCVSEAALLAVPDAVSDEAAAQFYVRAPGGLGVGAAGWLAGWLALLRGGRWALPCPAGWAAAAACGGARVTRLFATPPHLRSPSIAGQPRHRGGLFRRAARAGGRLAAVQRRLLHAGPHGHHRGQEEGAAGLPLRCWRAAAAAARLLPWPLRNSLLRLVLRLLPLCCRLLPRRRPHRSPQPLPATLHAMPPSGHQDDQRHPLSQAQAGAAGPGRR